MNELLQLKGTFVQRNKKGPFGPPKLRQGAIVTVDHMLKLQNDLTNLISFWSKEEYVNGALVSVYYVKLAAKSNRINVLLCEGSRKPNDSIVGARYAADNEKHIITHYVRLSTITKSIEMLDNAIQLLTEFYSGEVSADLFNFGDFLNDIPKGFLKYSNSKIRQLIVDVSYVEKFDTLYNEIDPSKESIITIYKTDKKTEELFEQFGLRLFNSRILDDTTVLLDYNQIDVLYRKAPYLIAMATVDLSTLDSSHFNRFESENLLIPSPKNEPFIGVIDTLFDEKVYFSEWVDFRNRIDPNIQTVSEDYLHGTAVSSIIVDGPSLNPKLEDFCGRFRVRHFGVCKQSGYSSFTILKEIRTIISCNRDIKVWNLSLGSSLPTNNNFISVEGAVLDQIQKEFDVVFIVSATNKLVDEKIRKIGAPADSINSIVVSSVDFDGKIPEYAREGIVLSYFLKPDISYYGGGKSDPLTVCYSGGFAQVTGTSFSAPWITRKMAYLMYIIGLSREVAKALLIDSAIGWNSNISLNEARYKGNGIVPISIRDILTCPKDEIKFFVEGRSQKYDTYNYHFPIPMHKDKFPYYAKLTFCYFPTCSRNQGVDYTNTELDVYFGRMKGDKVYAINGNVQCADEFESDDVHYVTESVARKHYSKWDSVKHIAEQIKTNPIARKNYGSRYWGMSIKTKNRLNLGDDRGLRFGAVVTIKEMNNVNRIDDFIQMCNVSGWLVEKINIENKIDIYQKAEEIILLD